MERILIERVSLVFSEPALFCVKSGLFLFAAALVLYVALAANYPAVHDTLHNFRHALAVVPCH